MRRGLCLRLSFALCLGNLSPQCCNHNPADGCHLRSTFSIRSLDPGAPRGTWIMSTDRCGQRIMLSYLLIRIENAAHQGRWCCWFCPNGFKLAASIPAEIDD